MKKLILMTGFLLLLASCGGSGGVDAPLGQIAVKDKTGTVVGYLANDAILMASIGLPYMTFMQDVNSNFAVVSLADGKLLRFSTIYFSDENCGKDGTAYIDTAWINMLISTYPFMTDSSKAAADATATAKTYNIGSIAAGTETIKSFIVLDNVYSDVNRYNENDSSTDKYKCVTVAQRLTLAITDGRAGAAGIGQCTSTSGEVTCSDIATNRDGTSDDYCSKAAACNPGTFTPYAVQTALPITDETYYKGWGVLTVVSTKLCKHLQSLIRISFPVGEGFPS